MVEDEEWVRSYAQSVLRGAGFDVLTARDGLEAVAAFEENAERLAVVLLDAALPKLSGEQAFARMSSFNTEIPIIVTSDYDQESTAQRLLGKGISGSLQKPYGPGDLIDKLRQVLRD